MQPKQLPGFTYKNQAQDPYAAFAMSLQRQRAQQAPKPKQQGKGGFLSSIISELGGAGGAAGGAAIGTALLPGVGTLVGAGLGGFLGGTGGRVAENKIRDNRIGIGDALKEGSLAGALSAAGQGYNLYKGAKAAKAGVQGIEELSKIGKVGTSLRSNVVNPKVAASPFGANQEANLVKTLNGLGLKGSAKNQYEKLPGVMSKLGGEIDTALAKNTNTSTLSKLVGEVKTNTKALPQFINGEASYNKALTSELKDLTSKFGSSKISAAEVQAAKTDLSSKMGSIFNKVAKGADLNPKEASRLAIWKGLDSHVVSIAPEVKALTAQQGKLYEAAPGLLAKSKKTLGIPLLGIKSSAAERLAQGSQDLAGRTLQAVGGVGKAAAPATGGIVEQTLKGIPKNLKVQAPGNYLGAAGMDTQPMEQDPQQSQDEQLMQIYEQLSGGQAPMGGQDLMGQMGGQMPEQPTYTVQQAMADIAKYPKDQAKIMDYYKFVNAASETNSKPLNSTAQQRVGNATSGLDSIGVLESTLATDPGAFQRQALPNPLGITARLTGTSDLRAATDNVVDVIARLRSGAAITDSEAARFSRLLPRAGDSPQTAARKIAQVRRDLENVVGMAQGGGQEQDLQSALMNAGGY